MTYKKALFIGFGGIAERHLQALQSIAPSLEIAVLRRIGNKKPEGVHFLFSKWEEIVDFRPDFALICSPTSVHLEDAKQLVEMQIPFLIEKPVAASHKGLKELCQAIEKTQLTTYVACQLRFDPLIQYIQSEVSQKPPQRIRLFCHSYLPQWRPERDYREIYSAHSNLGGGVGLDLIHEFDYLSWWFGLPLKTAGFRTKVSPLEINSDDQCSATLLYEKMVAEISLSYGEKNQRRGFELAYQDYFLRGDLLTGELIRHQEGEERVEKTFERNPKKIFRDQMQHFLDCITHQKTSLNTFESGAQILNLILQLEIQ